MNANIGIDNNGYILNQIHINNIPKPWMSLVNEAVYEIKDKFKDNIHSIYIYGSVGRGNPRFNFSDLDFTVVLNSKITNKISEDFELINKKLSVKYSFIRELGFDLGFIEEVLDKDNFYSWGFWLKNCCYCLEGKDLSKGFPKFKPSNKIAKAINGDIKNWIENYKTKIINSKNENQTKLYCQQIMKKIIRTGFTSIMEVENSWTDDLKMSYDLFLKHYPNKKNLIKKSFDLIEEPVSNKDELIKILDKFNWLVI